MRTKHYGVSARNTHINKLVAIAKNNPILKLFSILFMLTSIHLAYADTKTFTFLYGSGVESMDYQNTFNYDINDINSVVASPTSSQLNITVGHKFKSNSSEANEFNSWYDANQKMGLDTTSTNAADTDVFIEGVLTINGVSVAPTFALAHEHKNLNWWIAVSSEYGGRSSTGSAQLNLKETYGNNYYCLTQNGNSNYQVIVTKGNCSATPPQTYQFTFQNGKEVNTLNFVPLESPESGMISYITESFGTINVSAVPLNSGSVANGFNNLMQPNYQCDVDQGNSIYDFEVYVQGAVCGPAPQYLDFYVSGNLVINGGYVINSYTGTSRVFVLAHGEGRWWLGTVGGPFEAYGGGGVTYKNHATVETSNARFKLVATSQSSFIVNEK